MQSTRVCKLCGVEKPLRDFGRDSARKDSTSTTCKQCMNAKLRGEYRSKYEQVLLYRVKANAKARGVPFNLEHGDLKVPSRCPVLGIELAVSEGFGGSDNSPSVDRIRPELGYVKGNVVVISGLANRIKDSATSDQILAVGNWLKKLEIN